MLGSSVLDVAIGLVFLFLAVSLAASAITEAIASAMKLRQTTLRRGIGALLNDPEFKGLALSLYNHALVNPLGSGAATSMSGLKALPAYIPARNFALALITMTQPIPAEDQPVPVPQQPGAGAPAPVAPKVDATLADLVAKITDPQIRQTLTVLLVDVGHDREAFLDAVGSWFDASMDRLSGWYKRYTQLIGAGGALVICAILNADALRIGMSLWRTPALIAELKATTTQSAEQAIKTLDGLGLLGWAPGHFASLSNDPWGIVSMILGWLIVAGASLFGAPFWFDTLQRFVSLAGTGPGAKDGGTAGAGRP